MTKSQHKRTAVASMFQNGVSWNTKCADRDGFRRDSHIYIVMIQYNNNIKHKRTFNNSIAETLRTICSFKRLHSKQLKYDTKGH